MCEYIYITKEDKVVEHERVCAKNGHPEHRDMWIENNWVPV